MVLVVFVRLPVLDAVASRDSNPYVITDQQAYFRSTRKPADYSNLASPFDQRIQQSRPIPSAAEFSCFPSVDPTSMMPGA